MVDQIRPSYVDIMYKFCSYRLATYEYCCSDCNKIIISTEVKLKPKAHAAPIHFSCNKTIHIVKNMLQLKKSHMT